MDSHITSQKWGRNVMAAIVRALQTVLPTVDSSDTELTAAMDDGIRRFSDACASLNPAGQSETSDQAVDDARVLLALSGAASSVIEAINDAGGLVRRSSGSTFARLPVDCGIISSIEALAVALSRPLVVRADAATDGSDGASTAQPTADAAATCEQPPVDSDTAATPPCGWVDE